MSLRWSGVTALTVAWLPTGIKTGVGTAPWGVLSSPRRAALSAAVWINLKVTVLSMFAACLSLSNHIEYYKAYVSNNKTRHVFVLSIKYLTGKIYYKIAAI